MSDFISWLIDYCQSQIISASVSDLVLFIWCVCWLTGFGVGFLGVYISSLFIQATK